MKSECDISLGHVLDDDNDDSDPRWECIFLRNRLSKELKKKKKKTHQTIISHQVIID